MAKDHLFVNSKLFSKSILNVVSLVSVYDQDTSYLVTVDQKYYGTYTLIAEKN